MDEATGGVVVEEAGEPSSLVTGKSTHRVEVVPIRLEPHPNADSLSIVRVFDGYTVCVRTADWVDRTLAAYVPPDSVVPDTPAFAWLGGHRRIKVKRLRGVLSMGLLIPAPEGTQIGDDVAARLGITHYEPALHQYTTGQTERPPDGYHPIYDVDSLRRYGAAFIQGEPVVVTEKIHGANARYLWQDNRMWAGSRTEWKRLDPENLWWRGLWLSQSVPSPWWCPRGIQGFCMNHPGVTVYGEVYGQVQNLKYGRNDVAVMVFDILEGGIWWPFEKVTEAALKYGFDVVPVIANSLPFDLETVLGLAEGNSLVRGANHVREGCCVRPLVERMHPTIGRVHLKVVGNGYLERN